jgi:hypothetical protein
MISAQAEVTFFVSFSLIYFPAFFSGQPTNRPVSNGSEKVLSYQMLAAVTKENIV